MIQDLGFTRARRGGGKLPCVPVDHKLFFLFSQKKNFTYDKKKIDKQHPPPILKKTVRRKSLDRGGGPILILPPQNQLSASTHASSRRAQHTLLDTAHPTPLFKIASRFLRITQKNPKKIHAPHFIKPFVIRKKV